LSNQNNAQRRFLPLWAGVGEGKAADGDSCKKQGFLLAINLECPLANAIPLNNRLSLIMYDGSFCLYGIFT